MARLMALSGALFKLMQPQPFAQEDAAAGVGEVQVGSRELQKDRATGADGQPVPGWTLGLHHSFLHFGGVARSCPVLLKFPGG
jgi:hypothetical protein